MIEAAAAAQADYTAPGHRDLLRLREVGGVKIHSTRDLLRLVRRPPGAAGGRRTRRSRSRVE